MLSAVNMSASLPCISCRAIVPDRRQLEYLETTILNPPFERIDLYPKYPGIASSAQAGCSLCHLIWQRLTSIPPEATEAISKGNGKFVWISSEQQIGELGLCWDQKVRIRVGFDFLPYTSTPPSGSGRLLTPHDGEQYGGAVISMFVRGRPVSGAMRLANGEPWNGDTFEFSVFDSIDLYSPRLEWMRRLPSSETLSDENVRKIHDWIGDCVNNHSECSNPRTTTNWVPSRLLEINGDGRIRLIETSETTLSTGAKFAALSHVWGDIKASPPLCLLSSNFSQLKRGIQQSRLPRTFADAVKTCARLEIRYLWIDSLCIIQDSRDDWREQAVLMHLVYSYALITIVATSATSSHEGFLERHIDSLPTAKVTYSLSVTDGRSAAKDGCMVIYDYGDPHNIWRMFAINGSKWNTRAWTMQERSLSTRMVHFCRNKIFFECRGCLSSEENEPVQEFEALNSILWPRDPSTSYAEFLQHWQLFVGEYTSRNLTVGSDRLLAIQSVAEEMAAVTGQRYVQFSGMWQSNLRQELLWSVLFGKAKRPDAWRAPSWSWASVEGQISLWQRDFRSSRDSLPGTLLKCLSLHPFEVIEMDREYPDLDSNNPGFLKIKSLAKPFGHLKRHDSQGAGRDFFPYDLIVGKVLNMDKSEGGPKVFAHGRLDVEDLTYLDESPTRPRRFLYLHIRDDGRATGLILRVRSGDDVQTPGAWTRIGIATLFKGRSETPILTDAFNGEDIPQVITMI